MADVHAMYDDADNLKDQGQYQDAIAKYLEILTIDDHFTLAHLALSVVYGKLGDHASAIKHGKIACELDAKDPFSFTALSVTYQRAYAGTGNREYIHLAEDAMATAHALQR